MAIIKNGLSMMMRGKVGAFSYYVSETRQIVRQAQNNSNFGATATRSPGQQSRRVLWANLVNFYSGNKHWMKKAFESLKPGVSVFNRFMQLNIPNAKVALTKAQAASKLWVVSPYYVSQGSLPVPFGGTFTPKAITLISFEEAPAKDATVAQVSQAILNNNADFLNGDAIIAIRFNGFASAVSSYTGTPRLATYLYREFVIDLSDTRAFSEAYPNWAIDSTLNLVCRDLEDCEAYTYIHSRTRGGSLQVSTSRIVVSPDVESKLPTWASNSQVADATESYKVEQEVMLAPGGSTRGNSSVDGGGSTPGGGGGDDDENLGE